MLKALHAAAAMVLAWTLCFPTMAVGLPNRDLMRFVDRGSAQVNAADEYDAQCDKRHRLTVHQTNSYLFPRCVPPEEET